MGFQKPKPAPSPRLLAPVETVQHCWLLGLAGGRTGCGLWQEGSLGPRVPPGPWIPGQIQPNHTTSLLVAPAVPHDHTGEAPRAQQWSSSLHPPCWVTHPLPSHRPLPVHKTRLGCRTARHICCLPLRGSEQLGEDEEGIRGQPRGIREFHLRHWRETEMFLIPVTSPAFPFSLHIDGSCGKT